MKKIPGIAFLMLLLMLHTACDKCTTVDDHGNPERKLRLVQSGQNAWFGSNAMYDPQEAKFVHERVGELPYSVDESNNVVRVVFPQTQVAEENIELQLDSVTSVNIRYASLEFEQNCAKLYELSYIFVNGQQICRECGKDDKVISVPVN